MGDFFLRLFDTADFPARWNCGNWTAGHGWLHVISDLGVWSAYVAIPCVLAYFAVRRRDLPFRKLFWLFGALILACGTTHLMEAAIFWWPAYRLAGMIKLFTAAVSWGTVVALVPATPLALALRSPRALEREIAERRKVEEELLKSRAELERRVAARTVELAAANEALKEEVEHRKRAEAALRNANSRKDEFLAMLGHELRNPLAGISGALQVLATCEAPDAEATEMLAVIRRQTGHMCRLIDDLLDVSRITRSKLHLRHERIDLCELVRHGCQDFRRTHGTKGLKLEAELTDGPLWLDGDRTRLAQVLVNLLHNASKFSHPGGTITVRLSAEASTNSAVLSVADAGIGIEHESLGRLFEPFIQVHQGTAVSHEGLGLGLALVKGLVELHGGRATASSAGPGQGAEFTVRLPLATTPVVAPQLALAAAGGEQAALRVLVIDDSRDASLPLEKLLSRLGHQVELAHDGPSGVEAARRWRPAVVLCDIGMPGGMDGYQVAETLRRDAELRDSFLVAITGYGQDEDRRRAVNAGFDRHVTKPMSVDVLRSLLADAIRRGAAATRP